MRNPAIEPNVGYSEAAIFGRLLKVKDIDDNAPELAKHILSLNLSSQDNLRFDG